MNCVVNTAKWMNICSLWCFCGLFWFMLGVWAGKHKHRLNCRRVGNLLKWRILLCLWVSMWLSLMNFMNSFYPYEYRMNLCSAGHSVFLHGKNINVGHNTQTFGPKLFIPAMFTGTFDFYHLIPLSLTLTLLIGHKVSAKQNFLASSFRWSVWILLWYWSNSN